MGPMLLMGISQIRGFEPGDAEWGVKLDDVRGQAEAKEEIRRVVTLWQSGEAFEARGRQARARPALPRRAGHRQDDAGEGDRDRASTRRSSRSRAPGFAQTFIGIDAIIVRFLARKAKKLAREVGRPVHRLHRRDRRRRHAPARWRCQVDGASPTLDGATCSTGRTARSTRRGDLILETRAWRERLFEQRAPERRVAVPGWCERSATIVNQGMFPGGMSAAAASSRSTSCSCRWTASTTRRSAARVFTNKINPILDASYVVPRRIGAGQPAPAAAAAARRPDLLHRRDERPDRAARPGADAPGPHGPPRLVPHADEGGPPRHLRPLPRRRSRTTPSSTGRSGATRSRASRRATRRR